MTTSQKGVTTRRIRHRARKWAQIKAEALSEATRGSADAREAFALLSRIAKRAGYDPATMMFNLDSSTAHNMRNLRWNLRERASMVCHAVRGDRRFPTYQTIAALKCLAMAKLSRQLRPLLIARYGDQPDLFGAYMTMGLDRERERRDILSRMNREQGLGYFDRRLESSPEYLDACAALDRDVLAAAPLALAA